MVAVVVVVVVVVAVVIAVVVVVVVTMVVIRVLGIGVLSSAGTSLLGLRGPDISFFNAISKYVSCEFDRSSGLPPET